MAGDIADTEAAVLLELSDVNGSISDLINNKLQPQLEDKIEQQIAIVMAELSAVNVSITGIVESTGESINTNVDSAETSLTNLMNDVETNVLSGIDSTESNLDTALTNVKVTLSGEIADTEAAVLLELSDVNGSISDLINNKLQPQLEDKIEQQIAIVMAELSAVNVSITGIVESTGESINTNVDSAETSLTNLMNDVETNVLSGIDSTEATLDTSLTNVEINLTNSLIGTENTITTQLTAVNASISGLLIGTMQPELEALMTQQYNSIMSSVADVYTDTQWIVNNAMNKEDMVEVENRFSSLDSDLDKVLAFCGESVTNSSVLCQEIYNIEVAIENMRTEQEAQFDELNQTTYTTWQYLSGSISNRIDNILVALNVIQDQNEEINATTHEILDEIQGEIRANIIS